MNIHILAEYRICQLDICQMDTWQPTRQIYIVNECDAYQIWRAGNADHCFSRTGVAAAGCALSVMLQLLLETYQNLRAGSGTAANPSYCTCAPASACHALSTCRTHVSCTFVSCFKGRAQGQCEEDARWTSIPGLFIICDMETCVTSPSSPPTKCTRRFCIVRQHRLKEDMEWGRGQNTNVSWDPVGQELVSDELLIPDFDIPDDVMRLGCIFHFDICDMCPRMVFLIAQNRDHERVQDRLEDAAVLLSNGRTSNGQGTDGESGAPCLDISTGQNTKNIK